LANWTATELELIVLLEPALVTTSVPFSTVVRPIHGAAAPWNETASPKSCSVPPGDDTVTCAAAQLTVVHEIEVVPDDAPAGTMTVSGFAVIWPAGLAAQAVPTLRAKSSVCNRRSATVREVQRFLIARISEGFSARQRHSYAQAGSTMPIWQIGSGNLPNFYNLRIVSDGLR